MSDTTPPVEITYGGVPVQPPEDHALPLDQRIQMPTLKPKYPCPHCTKVYDTQQQLTGHLASHSPRRAKVPCPECGKRYVPGPGLAAHRSKIHGVPGKRDDLKMKTVRGKTVREVEIE